MNITFLVPCKDLAGGLRVVAAYGNALLRRGHDVAVIYPQRPLSLRESLRRKKRRLLYKERDHLDFFRGRLFEVPEISEKFMPDSDCLVATAWETAEWAKDFSPRCGKKFYLIQHYETWSGDQKDVDATFHYPFKKIVISNWLKMVIERMSGENDIPVISNGKDFFLSESLGDGLKKKYDVGMLYSPVPFKKTADGVAAIKEVTKSLPDLRVVFFGSEFPKEPLFKNAMFFRRPSQDKIRNTYLSTRVWISSSLTEGFCLPALEAISLGCAVVATNSLGIEDIIKDGEDGILVDPENPKALAEKILEVLNDPELEKRLRIASLKKSEAFSWEYSTDKLESLLTLET
ncbi:MAG: glycosyltransferase family 4 protein [Thermodesulfobacteriota bacterium]|nr:glycosyltransferase family 4 protein [Thermodesulfobacteriota bacterium]